MAKWTVLIYMVANLDAELDAAATRDLREIERAMKRRKDDGKPDDVQAIVRIKRTWPTEPQVYTIDQSGTRLQPARKRVATTRKATMEQEPAITKPEDRDELRTFLTNSLPRRKTTGDKFALVLWGHSYGLGFGRDHGEALTLSDLAYALNEFKKAAGRPLDLLGANACAMGYVEAACEFAGAVDYMAASQIAVPYAGWPYHSILSTLDARHSPEAFGTLIVEHYVNSFAEVPTGDRVSMTLYDLGQTGTLTERFRALTTALTPLTEGKDLATRLAHLRAAFRVAAAGDVRPLLDLTDLCCRLKELAEDLNQLGLVVERDASALQNAARQMTDFLEVGVGKKPFIVAHQKHAELEDLHGVGVFAPFVTDVLDLKRLELIAPEKDDIKEYKALTLAQVRDDASKPTWATLVYDTLGTGLPEEVLTSTASSGAATRADRRAVSQILVTVDALFDVLDRRIEAGSRTMLGALRPPGTPGGVKPTPGKPTVTQFPALQLLGYDTLQDEAKRRATLKKPAGSTPARVARRTRGGQANGLLGAAASFGDIEGMLGNVERAVARTLTNATYGLGPGVAPGVAGFGGERDDSGKPIESHGADSGKPIESHGRKPIESHGRKPIEMHGAAGDGSDAGDATPAGLVTSLFAQIGGALAAVEAALGSVETATALALTPSTVESSLGVVRTAPPLGMQLERGFDLLRDASTDARRTLKTVLAHPVYGIGPGPGSITVDDRRAMARAGGFSSAGLTLLSARPEVRGGAGASPRRRTMRKNSAAKRTVKKTGRKKQKRPRK